MIATAVNVANVKTMADGGIRITLDLLPGSSEQIAQAHGLMSTESFMYLGSVDEFSTDESSADS